MPSPLQKIDTDPFYGTPLQPDAPSVDTLGSSRPFTGAPTQNRGRTTIISPLNAAGGLIIGLQHAIIVETSKLTGDEAEAISITLGIATYPNVAADVQEPVDVIARITWGAGDALFTADVDWENGRVLGVLASSVRVEALYTTVASVTAFNPPTLSLSASLAYGSRSGLTAKRTLLLGSVAAGATSALVRIPRFATGLTLLASSAPHSLTAKFYQDNSGARAPIGTATRTEISENRLGAFSMPSNSNYVSITNNSVGAMVVTAMFAIDL